METFGSFHHWPRWSLDKAEAADIPGSVCPDGEPVRSSAACEGRTPFPLQLAKDVEYATAFVGGREQACEALESEARVVRWRASKTPVLYRGEPCYEQEFDPASVSMANSQIRVNLVDFEVLIRFPGCATSSSYSFI
jgi:hypothetical protein